MLPADVTVVGIDEQTALVLDLEPGKTQVLGCGSVHILGPGGEMEYAQDAVFDISAMGRLMISPAGTGITPKVYRRALAGNSRPVEDLTTPPSAVQALAVAWENTRQVKNWGEADRLRRELDSQGWSVKDTPQGAMLECLKQKGRVIARPEGWMKFTSPVCGRSSRSLGYRRLHPYWP